MANYAIEFENVGKQYRLGRVGTGTIAHDLNRWWQTSILGKEDPYLKIGETNDRTTKGQSDYVWALRDISFKVEQGDVVGIIGKNGAGKSTLLKLLSHITAPSTGRIGFNGRIASLLEVGTGFHPEMTARENIYMNGSIMGMTRHEITSKLDEIVEFAGVGRYLDTPVKRFSSGMTVRLGFAVAAFLEPEILVVDEVLAVGDAEFQKKAIGKMKDISNGTGRTVLFVSHNMAAVRSLCKSGIVLKNGMIDHIGTSEECVSRYLNANLSPNTIFTMRNFLVKSKVFHIDDVKVNGQAPQTVYLDKCNNTLNITIDGTADVDVNVQFILQVYDSNSVLIGTYSPMTYGRVDIFHQGEYHISERIYIPEALTNGEYRLALILNQRGIETLAEIENLCTIIRRDCINEHVGIAMDHRNTGFIYLNGEKA